mmetsp:Transcript_61705/g.142197  ORF Transcript_61705/g.142197 Transcript_61705/m.142197 type:complete len:203 (-) Transcript_61705:1219-1827(-)
MSTLASCLVRASWPSKICRRAPTSGSLTYSRRSRRPGRVRAGSSVSGRFVAAMTITCLLPSIPSISLSIWLRTRAPTPPESPSPRAWPIASTSSKNTTQGDAPRAFRNRSRTAFSLSPTHLENSSGPLMEMKFISLSVATALAIMVFEHPGGPYSSTPWGGVILICLNSAACLMGHSTASRRDSFNASYPPMSPHRTLGTST